MAFTGNFTCNVFKAALLGGEVDFAPGTSDVFRIALYTNAATLNQDTAVYTIEGEVVASGYTAGGEVLIPTVGTLGGVSYVSFANTSWNAALTARGALVYKVGGPAVCVLDFGADRTSVMEFTVQFPPATATSALLRIL
jgi:hypothetical protein